MPDFVELLPAAAEVYLWVLCLSNHCPTDTQVAQSNFQVSYI